MKPTKKEFEKWLDTCPCYYYVLGNHTMTNGRPETPKEEQKYIKSFTGVRFEYMDSEWQQGMEGKKRGQGR